MVALPAIPGPKLGPFNGGKPAKLEFLRLVSEAGHSYVWKVLLDGRVYALKIFIFAHFTGIGLGIQSDLDKAEAEKELGVNIDLLIQQYDPFFCECRAFARLRDTDTQHIAIKCHGYLAISTAHEEWLVTKGAQFERPAADPPGTPLRAIVKDFVEDPVPFTPSMMPRIMRNVRDMHRVGIVNRDIKTANYMQGKLFDFSSAWTTPHVAMDGAWGARDDVELEAAVDYECVDDMIDEWNQSHRPRIWRRMAPSSSYKEKLRGCSFKVRLAYHPNDFDWKGVAVSKTRKGNKRTVRRKKRQISRRRAS